MKYININSDIHLLKSRRYFNPLTPNDHNRGCTAPLTSKRFILSIYSTNIGTEHFKHSIYSPFLSLQNAVCFIILTYLVPVLFTFYKQCVLKLKKKNHSGDKRLSIAVLNILKFYIPSTEINAVFCKHLRTKSDYFTTQHQQTCFRNIDGKCLLRVTS